ncbi:MAG: sulfite exporter TauE/SafE family protein [Bacteroidia bacterium]|nr:sulfite exporter TauE/SafE family protein [Bacteroidia bacterium]
MLTAFTIGLFGSLHCVGMCGPIAFALPGKGMGKLPYLWGRLLYNLGRIVTYSLLGGIVALLGVGASMFHLQQSLSLGLGVLVLLWAIREFGQFKLPFQIGVLDKFTAWIRRGFGRYFSRATLDSMFMIGLLNGLLPCGFVYMGLMNAAMSDEVWQGMAAMALFGAGTFPLMFAMAFGARFVTVKMRTFINRSVPWVLTTVGLLFILRGMGLGIPYVSPKFVADAGGKVEVVCGNHGGK